MSVIDIDLDMDEVEEEEEDSSLKLPRGYISNSQVQTYYQCGWKYYLSYCENAPRTSSVATSLGKSVHRLVEDTLRDVMEGKKLRSIEQVMDEAGGIVSAELSELESLADPDTGIDKDEGHWVDKAREYYRVWHQLRAATIQPIAVEKHFRTVLKGVPVTGVIDLIDISEGPAVIDLKVTKRKKSERDLKNSTQLALYGHVEGIARVGYDNVVKNKVPQVHTIRHTLSKKEGEWAATLVRDVADCVTKEVFPKTSPDNWWCSERFCDHWNKCRGK